MTTTVSHQPIDPTKGARFPITISEQLWRDDRPKKRQRVSVQCNHRTKVSGSTKTTITPGQTSDSYNLSVTNDEKGEYKYNGSQQPSSTIALIYDSVEKSFTLDKLDAEFRFNLRSTPTQNDATGHYPQLDTGLEDGTREGESGLFGEGSDEEDPEDTTPDPNNPYDYRHFLNKGNRSPSPVPSYASSPVRQPVFNSTPMLSASSPRRQPVATPTSRPSRPKQRTKEKPHYLSPKPRQEEVDADNEDSSPDDPNELVIDMGDSRPAHSSKPWRSALGVLNDGGRGSGPISLRSAASSMSPSIRGGSPEDNGDEAQAESDVDADADDDVEEMDLGITIDEPVAPPCEEVVTPGNGWDDNDDDLEAELTLALEEDQAKSDMEGAVRGRSEAVVNGESSEESEEE